MNGYAGGRHRWAKHLPQVFSAEIACSAGSWDKWWLEPAAPCYCCPVPFHALASAGVLLIWMPCNHLWKSIYANAVGPKVVCR